jgi:SpoVK/Ycf46/Vps4 family AAA+-type ATPase
MNPKEILSSRHNVAKLTRVLRAADGVLDSLFKARDGSKLSQGLAVAGALGSLLDVLVPEQAPHDQLLDMGYKPLNLGLGEFFCDLLAGSELPRRQFETSASTSIVFWKIGSTEPVAAVFHNDSYEAGPYVLGGTREMLGTALQVVAWDGETDLMLDTVGVSARRSRGKESRDYVLQPLGEPGAFFGVPGLEWFVDRLKRHEGETRSMLLVGPTGAGKSTLGRLISRQIDGGKLIKVGARVIRGCSVTDLVEIAEFLQPDVLLLDDISMIARSEYARDEEGNASQAQMLELMEGLHGKARLVIATLMMEPQRSARGGYVRLARRRGSGSSGKDYFDGMRPGRVDEVVRIKRPSPKVREKIMLHYFGGAEGLAEAKVTKKIFADMVERTEGLTGAYLKEVVHRVQVHGVKTYKGEIKSILEHAPRVNNTARRHARGVMPRRRRVKRKSVWEKRCEDAALKIEALMARNEALTLKLKAAKK